MKTFYKISLIIAAVFAVIGVLGISIGLAMGGSLQDYNQIGIFYDDGEIEFYPDYRELENWEENLENKWDRWEDHWEERLEKQFAPGKIRDL